jgi:exonuclease III
MIKLFRFLLFGLVIIASARCEKDNETGQPVKQIEGFSIMTYNILYTTANDGTLKVLQETNADIIGFQETSATRLSELAQKLHFYYHNFKKSESNMSGEDTGILSRFPITRFFHHGVVIKINQDLQVAVFSVHLSPYPYEPYDFRDGKITTPEQAVTSASFVRLPQIKPVLEEIGKVESEGIPVFLLGDFNEPSWMDWTPGTSAKNMHFSQIVQWPVSKAIADAGLIDVYRQKFPDPVKNQGNTWTTIESEDEVYDRIDIIYHRENEDMELTDVKLVGGTEDAAGLTVEGYASDHYAVLASYRIKLK